MTGDQREPSRARDPRIYMAAERTFLAWIRTGLALMGFGFVVARFGLFLQRLVLVVPNIPVKSTGFSLSTGTALVMAGVVVNVAATAQHLRVIRYLNEGRDITGRPSHTGVILSILLALVGVAMSVYLFVFRQ